MRASAVGLVLAFGTACPAAVTLFDLTADFNLDTNEASNRWSYWTYPSTITFDFMLLPSISSIPADGVINDVAAYDAWASAEFPGYPYPNVGALGGAVVAIPDGDMAARPAIVSWLSPGAGRIGIEYAITDLDPGSGCVPESDGVRWRLRVNAENALHGEGTQVDTGIESGGSTSGVRTLSGIEILADRRVNMRIHDAGGCIDHDLTEIALRIWFTPAGECEADITGPMTSVPDGNVDSLDFLALIAQWGDPCGAPCTADITGPSEVSDGVVGALDFLMMLSQWGTPADCS